LQQSGKASPAHQKQNGALFGSHPETPADPATRLGLGEEVTTKLKQVLIDAVRSFPPQQGLQEQLGLDSA
jgi:hypothetical protein